MATTTPNNGWPVPTSTDLVTNGAIAIEALGDAIDASINDGLKAWQTWSPVLSNGWANGNGTYTALYCKIGKTIHWLLQFTVGSSTTKGTQMTFSLPVTGRTGGSIPTGQGVMSVGAFLFNATSTLTTTNMTVYATNSASTYAYLTGITSSVPGTWVTGDFVRLTGTYEAA